MKLSDKDTNDRRETLCKVLIEIAKRKTKVESLKEELKEDFEKNEKAYRGGIVTAVGVLYRRPRWDVTAKEKVEVPE